ncbi:hypothetical protein C0993_007470 [Termitomyces sp. T159_Od127]|nr:hypothetical protein C0993_007470 [Termitomyces sp. T159_Od127]
MSSLHGYVDRRVLLILQDGRAIVGTLAGFDQKSNVVLADSKERVYSTDQGVEEIPLGLYLVKGDMVYVLPPVPLPRSRPAAPSSARSTTPSTTQSTSPPSAPSPSPPSATECETEGRLVGYACSIAQPALMRVSNKPVRL